MGPERAGRTGAGARWRRSSASRRPTRGCAGARPRAEPPGPGAVKISVGRSGRSRARNPQQARHSLPPEPPARGSHGGPATELGSEPGAPRRGVTAGTPPPPPARARRTGAAETWARSFSAPAGSFEESACGEARVQRTRGPAHSAGVRHLGAGPPLPVTPPAEPCRDHRFVDKTNTRCLKALLLREAWRTGKDDQGAGAHVPPRPLPGSSALPCLLPGRGRRGRHQGRRFRKVCVYKAETHLSIRREAAFTLGGAPPARAPAVSRLLPPSASHRLALRHTL